MSIYFLYNKHTTLFYQVLHTRSNVNNDIYYKERLDARIQWTK